MISLKKFSPSVVAFFGEKGVALDECLMSCESDMGTDGVMTTGWLSDGGAWYYFDASGIMAVGWKYIGVSWYYFQPSGATIVSES